MLKPKPQPRPVTDPGFDSAEAELVRMGGAPTSELIEPEPVTYEEKLERLTYLDAHARKAEAEFHRALKRAFPKGAEITWDHHGHEQTGTVTWVSGDRFQVRNHKTGNVVPIYFYQVQEAAGIEREYFSADA